MTGALTASYKPRTFEIIACNPLLFELLLSAVQAAVVQVNQAVSAQDQAALLAALRLEALALLGVHESNAHWYLEHFTTYCQHKSKVRPARCVCVFPRSATLEKRLRLFRLFGKRFQLPNDKFILMASLLFFNSTEAKGNCQ